MELNLTRVDYTHIGLLNRKCMKLLPQSSSGGKMQQKVVIGDADGVVQVFGVKKREISQTFKTLPHKPITRLEFGGALGTIKDKIFVSCGNEVKGYTKKGKLFLDFETNLTEKIESMSVSGSDLAVSGNHIYNHYHDCHDTNYFLSSDIITDTLLLPGEKVSHVTPVLACQDRTLKVLKDSELMYSVDVPGPPSTLQLYYNDGGEHGDEIIYGTVDGKVGFIQLSRRGPHHGWLIDNDDGMTQGSVQCIDNYDLTGDGIRELIVGRHDGNIEVYSYQTEEDSSPILKFSHNCGESVTSVVGGVVGNAGYDEILASTYSGWIFGLTSEMQDSQIQIEPGRIIMDETTRQKMEKLKSEVDQLQNKVVKERERMQKISSSDTGVSAIPMLHINDQLVLSQNDASYVLSLEVQTSIDNVLLQSEVPIDLLDVEKNSAVVSYSTCDPESDNALLATYRCQANTTRLEIKIRTVEGQYGSLRAYITPRSQPKCCQVQEYKIKPLSLHRRTSNFDEKRPMNVLRLSGSFSMSEIHSWISFCLPEVPEKIPNEDSAELCFISTFIGTMLRITYKKNLVTCQSDNISTISILKDFLTKEATHKRTNLEIDCDVREESLLQTLVDLVHPKLEAQLLLAKQVALIEPLRDLSAHETEKDFLAPEYKFILDNAESIQNSFKKQPAHLERIYGTITDLYIDQHKFHGVSVRNKIPQLLDILDKYTLESLLDFFQLNKK